MDTPMSDGECGWLLLIVSLIFMTTVLSLLVKVLQSVFRGRVAIWMQSLLNLEFKAVPFLADYVLVAFGAGITILMQSSSITTSTLTPLVGVGLIKLEKMLPFTVGANIGTTVTGIMSALASSNIKVGMEVALAHLFFNLIGTLLWFPIPFMRRVPLAMARQLGYLAADMRWFPFIYILTVFGLIPGVLLGLSLAGVLALVLVGIPFCLMFIGVAMAAAQGASDPKTSNTSLATDPDVVKAMAHVGIEPGAATTVACGRLATLKKKFVTQLRRCRAVTINKFLDLWGVEISFCFLEDFTNHVNGHLRL